jgi:hypothetical protein
MTLTRVLGTHVPVDQALGTWDTCSVPVYWAEVQGKRQKPGPVLKG